MKKQILIVGTGGQGIISLGRIMMNVAMRMDYRVRGAETHGMAQRGGSVLFHIRIGDFNAVTIPKQKADVIVGLEPVEVVRNLGFLKPNGIIIMSNKEIEPNTVHVGGIQYPEFSSLEHEMRKVTENIILVPIKEIQESLNHPKGENLIILGSFQQYTQMFDQETLENTIREFWPNFYEINKKALYAGQNAIAENVIPN